jgi:hypothetical protein
MKYYIILILCFVACNTHKKTAINSNSTTEFVPDYTPGPPTIVYKTKSDYSKNVPVILSDDKTTIVSYPHPNDINVGNSFPFPTQLNNGYLLDNRGINPNVAYLKLTYEEYSKLQNPLSLKEMYDQIIDKNPVTEMCDCGNQKAFTNLTDQLNRLITDKKLKTRCKSLK